LARRLLIVGAGVVGLSTAVWAAHDGLDVTVVDEGPAEGGGCSYGNAGMVVPSHFVPLAAPGMVARGLKWMWNPESPFYVRPRLDRALLGWGFRFWRSATAAHVTRSAPLLRDLHLASRRILEGWAAEWIDGFGLARQGLLMLCRTQHGLDEETRVAGQARALGIPADVLTAAEARALEPGFRLDVVGAVRYPLDCHLVPGRLMAGLLAEAARVGAKLLWNTAVQGWRTSGGRVDAARTSGGHAGDLVADEYVLAAGVWSTSLARDLGLRLPLQAGKGLSLTLREPRTLPRHCAILSEAHVAVTPMDGSLRVGGTMELAGLERTVSPARVRGIVRSVTEYLPDFTVDDFRGVPAWCGLRPCSPDGLPYVGRVSRYDNLTVAAGHAMMGVSLGPITGKLVAEIVSRRPLSLDIAALDPERYA
jgi:D-amino-acid dehydrogenase